MRIAFTGVFDIDNYGDHLFPIIFADNLKRRHIEAELFLFSPFSGEQGFGQHQPIYALRDLEYYHKKYQFDAIVVGGGEILHFFSFQQKNHQGEKVDYPIYETWLNPSLVGKKYGIPVIWNNPGCPFEFKGYQKYIAENLVKDVSYISVRNQFSYNEIRKLSGNVHLSVDTAFDLPNVYPKSELKCPIGKKYVVFHCNHYIGKDYYDEALEELLKLSEEYEIVLLPLAYTNDDHEIAQRLYNDSNKRFIFPDKELSMKQIVSYFAYTDLYIGVSFHGAISAFSYGNPVIAYDFFHNNKTKDLYTLIDMQEQYIDEIGCLHQAIEKSKLLGTEVIVQKYAKIEVQMEQHFANVIQVIQNAVEIDAEKEYLSFSDVLNQFSVLLRELSHEYQEKTGLIEKYKSEAQYNLLNWQQCSNELVETYNKYQSLKEKMDDSAV